MVDSVISENLKLRKIITNFQNSQYHNKKNIYSQQFSVGRLETAYIWKWKSLSCVWLCNPMDYTVHGILQARILEWVAFPFSRGSSQPRDRTRYSSLQADSLPAELQGKPKNTGVGSLSLLQWICLIQESTQGLLHCWQIQLNYQDNILNMLYFYVFIRDDDVIDNVQNFENWAICVSFCLKWSRPFSLLIDNSLQGKTSS